MIILVKVPVGGYCKVDEECHGTENSGVCKLEKCVCRTGYVLYNLKCHEGKLEMLFKKYILVPNMFFKMRKLTRRANFLV